jgi:hypothetical protein
MADDHDNPDPSAPPPAAGSVHPNIDPQEVYFPLPANREQCRIVEAITRRRGVLVQGPPGTGFAGRFDEPRSAEAMPTYPDVTPEIARRPGSLMPPRR